MKLGCLRSTGSLRLVVSIMPCPGGEATASALQRKPCTDRPFHGASNPVDRK